TTDAPGDVVSAAALLRTCLLPKAGLGDATRIWVTENGYATRGGAGEDRQASDLAGTVDALAAQSGTLGISDYRYFNLRDNRSTGADLFDAVGLLFDDGREKRAFGAYRGAIERYGAPAARPRLHVTVAPRRVRRGHAVTLRVRVTTGGRPAPGVLVRVGARRARTSASGRARVRIVFAGRPGRRTVLATRTGGQRATAAVRVVR
ncbi:MAG: hypothetical protein ACXVFT_18660, partial [Solirubrobacteraceae bacterium]